VLSAASAGCAEETVTGEQRVHIVKNNEGRGRAGRHRARQAGRHPSSCCRQREPSVRKCYNDVPQRRQPRPHVQGHPRRADLARARRARTARASRASRSSPTRSRTTRWTSCVVDRLKDFEYPYVVTKGRCSTRTSSNRLIRRGPRSLPLGASAPHALPTPRSLRSASPGPPRFARRSRAKLAHAKERLRCARRSRAALAWVYDGDPLELRAALAWELGLIARS